MESRFKRSEITSINNFETGSGNMLDTRKKRIAVPREESFAYVLNKARSGNEMAAVQIDEWYRFCKAHNNKEKQVLNQIKKAIEEIFE
jgi:hypothetical protein